MKPELKEYVGSPLFLELIGMLETQRRVAERAAKKAARESDIGEVRYRTGLEDGVVFSINTLTAVHQEARDA